MPAPPLMPDTYAPPYNGFDAIDTCLVIAGAYAEDTTGLDMYEEETAGAYEPAEATLLPYVATEGLTPYPVSRGDAICFTIGDETYDVETAGADEYFVTVGTE